MYEGGQDVWRELKDQSTNTIPFLVSCMAQAFVEYLPPNSLVLDFTILVIQGLNHSVNDLGTRMVVTIEKRRSPSIETAVKVVQRHVTQVRVCIAKFWQESQSLSRSGI